MWKCGALFNNTSNTDRLSHTCRWTNTCMHACRWHQKYTWMTCFSFSFERLDVPSSFPNRWEGMFSPFSPTDEKICSVQFPLHRRRHAQSNFPNTGDTLCPVSSTHKKTCSVHSPLHTRKHLSLVSPTDEKKKVQHWAKTETIWNLWPRFCNVLTL